MRTLRALRSALDGLYAAAGALAAACLVAMLLLIVAQMVARWTGEIFPGASSYAGYFMAAASFLAFAHALDRGAHIRVSILLNAVPRRARWALEVWCFGLGAAVAWYFTYHAFQFTYWSWTFGEVSQAQDASPMWIPQSVMVVGGALLAIALTDNLVHVLLRGGHRIRREVVDQGLGE